MRTAFVLTALLLAGPAARAQSTRQIENVQTSLWVLKLQDEKAGGFKPDPDGKPGLRATSAAVRALKYNEYPVTGPMREKVAAYVVSCYDPASGGFADTPGGKPDVTATSIGVMAAVEVGVPREKFRKAMDYLRDNAKTFEEVRLAAAAVEAWGVAECPFDLKPWLKVGADYGVKAATAPEPRDPRAVGSFVALLRRLDLVLSPKELDLVKPVILGGQRADGGWGKPGEAGSDLETTYRVMRAVRLLGEKPKDAAKLREFLGKCRTADGGYGVKPGEKATVGATYYAGIVRHWLDGMEKE